MTATDPGTEHEVETVVFSAEAARGGVISSAREAWKYRSFITYMTRRDLRTTYLRSYLGWMWGLINPLAELAIYSLVFGVILAGERGLPAAPGGFNSFPHFLLSGMVVWNFYRATSSKVLNSFTQTVKLRRKLYFPPVAPAISQTLTTIVQNSLEIVVLIVFFVVVGHFSITAIVIIPVALLAVTFGLGIGLLLSVANTKYNDVSYPYALVLRLFFYLVPIIWPIEFVDNRIDIPALRAIVKWNPIAKFLGISRDGLYMQQWPPLTDWVYVTGWSAAVLLAGWMVFARSSADVAEGLT
ncbi:MAG: ABC transporter permease [Acidimicrobiales bacterium]